MAGSPLILVLGLVAAIAMFGWGLAGVFTGRVLGKSYGRAADGRREFARYVLRNVEPIWFWVLCGTYMAMGAGLLAVVALFSLRGLGA